MQENISKDHTLHPVSHTDIVHDASAQKFIYRADNRESFLRYEINGHNIDLQQTKVDEADKDKGVSDALVESALHYAKSNDLKVIPSCGCVKTYIESHPHWKSLVTTQKSPKKSLQGKLSEYWPVALLVLYSLAGALLFVGANETTLVSFMHYFMGFFLVGFSFFKLLDLKGFKEAYAEYDLVAARYPNYGYAYPFVELLLGAAYLSFFAPLLIYVLTILVMGVSSIGVIQAVVRGKDIKCGCMGTLFDLPMSTITIIEDVAMVAMALVMLIY